MPLRLRRGTNTDRLTVTPLEGELVYTTDTKLLYVGDGTTIGGNLVSSTFSGTLTSNINLNGYDIFGTGNVNIFGNVEASNLTSAGNTSVGGLLSVNGNAFIQGSVDAAAFIGSVFRDNSSIIVDAITGNLHTDRIHAVGNQLRIVPETAGQRNELFIVTNENRSNLRFSRESNSDMTGSTVSYGAIMFERRDINGPFTPTLALGGENFWIFYATADGNFNDPTNALTWRNKQFGVGTTTPADTLDVRGSGTFTGVVRASAFKGSIFADDSTLVVDAINGNVNSNNLNVSGSAKIQGDVEASAFKGSVVGDDSSVIVDAINSTITVSGFIQFGSYSDAEIASVVPANGMVYYNTTNNRFRGYQNGAWINLDDGTAA